MKIKNRSILLIMAAICLLVCILLVEGIRMHVDWMFILIGIIGLVLGPVIILMYIKSARFKRNAKRPYSWTKFWIIYAICFAYGVWMFCREFPAMLGVIPLTLFLMFGLYMLWIIKRMRSGTKNKEGSDNMRKEKETKSNP